MLTLLAKWFKKLMTYIAYNAGRGNTVQFHYGPPSAIADLTAADSTITSGTQLNWTVAVTHGTASQSIQRSEVSGSGYSEIGTGSASTNAFTDTTGNPGTIYYYIVVTTDSYGQSTSNEVSWPFPTGPGGDG